MAKAPDGKTPDKRLTDRLKREEDLRRVIGQGIIDGLLSPVGVVRTNGDGYYGQTNGDYTQTGGFHDQGSGAYNQSP
ncbi:MAG: hypothetical protein CML67_11375 [Rhodobacteraceae bacterium]|nr:hypothetical protein [Paracoccaceae bacterium]